MPEAFFSGHSQINLPYSAVVFCLTAPFLRMYRINSTLPIVIFIWVRWKLFVTFVPVGGREGAVDGLAVCAVTPKTPA